MGPKLLSILDAGRGAGPCTFAGIGVGKATALACATTDGCEGPGLSQDVLHRQTRGPTVQISKDHQRLTPMPRR